ncbi:phytoene synthase [Lentzea atacamensis]|uniref:Phytoene synthase n=1 Tax=Lentzea atacamensis TaxID=531938 RepID=A0ABX9E1C8_9PSEU|nr:squalene/phytoene synthase family protein [Lentzea atacamensis]RAS60659.1 phytoene synthase [Lentzea atacamensis]
MLVRRWLDAAGVVDPVLRECYLFCVRDVARRDDGFAKFPLRALPAAFRPYIAAAIALGYAADDRADTGSVEGRRQRLDQWADAAATALVDEHSTDPVLHAAANTWRVWDLPSSIVEEMVGAMRRDTAFVEFTTYEELRVWSTAMTGGLFTVLALIAQRLGVSGNVVPVFRELGQLAQLVDLLCDLSDDLRTDRLYLPLEDLARFGVQAEELRAAHWTSGTAGLLAFEADRVRRRMPVLVAELEQLLPWPVAGAIGEYCELHVREVLASGPALLHRPIRPNPAEALAVWLPYWRSAIPC